MGIIGPETGDQALVCPICQSAKMRQEEVMFYNRSRRGPDIQGISAPPVSGSPRYVVIHFHCGTCQRDFNLKIRQEDEGTLVRWEW